MALALFSTLGSMIARTWGQQQKETTAKTLEGMRDERMILCVLCAIHSEVQRIRVKIHLDSSKDEMAALLGDESSENDV